MSGKLLVVSSRARKASAAIGRKMSFLSLSVISAKRPLKIQLSDCPSVHKFLCTSMRPNRYGSYFTERLSLLGALVSLHDRFSPPWRGYDKIQL